MKPFSAFYYIRENKARAAICIFMIMLTAGLYVMGNFIDAGPRSFQKDYEYSDKVVLVSGTSADTDLQDYFAFLEDVKKDTVLKYMERSARGFSGMQHGTAMGFNMGGASFVFNSAEDMKTMFAHLGIECDYTNVRNGSLVLSRDFANNKGLKTGDVVDHSFDNEINGTYTVDALIDDGSYTCFYVVEDNERLLRLYLYSDTLQGQKLYDYVHRLIGDKKIQVSQSYRQAVSSQFDMFYMIFYGVTFLISVIMAVTVNTVVTGQYLKRTSEFGVYRALGRSRREVAGKSASEILTMDAIAIVMGLSIAMLVMYLLNELILNPRGIYLPYCCKPAVLGYVLCNALIVAPLLISKGRMCCKADVTEF